MSSDEKKEEGRYGNIKVLSCKTRCRARSLVGGFFNFGLGFGLVWGSFFFFLFPLLTCNSSFQAEAEKYGLKPNSKPNARAL